MTPAFSYSELQQLKPYRVLKVTGQPRAVKN